MSPKAKKKDKKKKRKRTSKDDEEEIHELSYYMNDRFKLMKEVVKIMSPKKIKSMAPEFLKRTEFDDMMVLLMDELLGISNKRLKYIFKGQSDDVASSSNTDSEEEKPADDVISLSDITSGEDDVILCAPDTKEEAQHEKRSIKREKGRKILKSSKKKEKSPEKETTEKEKLMSVLELLELQARARAIRSQLAIEVNVDKQESKTAQPAEDSDPDAVLIASPKRDEIVISSSDSETEGKKAGDVADDNAEACSSKAAENASRKTQKVKIVREKIVITRNAKDDKRDVSFCNEEERDVFLSKEKEDLNGAKNKIADKKQDKESEKEDGEKTWAENKSEERKQKKGRANSCSDTEPDIIVINLDEDDDLV